MSRTMSVNVMAQLNMDGKTRRCEKRKTGFKGSELYNLILNIVTEEFKCTEADVRKKITNILKYAPDRHGGGGRGGGGRKC